MATLHVRNLPDGIYKELKDSASRENRSLSAEVTVLLARAVREESLRTLQSQLLSEICSHRFLYPETMPVPDGVTLLREDRER